MYGAEVIAWTCINKVGAVLIETEAYFVCTGSRSCGWDTEARMSNQANRHPSLTVNDLCFQKTGKSHQLEHQCICMLRRGNRSSRDKSI